MLPRLSVCRTVLLHGPKGTATDYDLEAPRHTDLIIARPLLLNFSQFQAPSSAVKVKVKFTLEQATKA
jgi:hypothetical protein